MPFIYAAITWFLAAPARSFFWNVTLTTAYATLSFAVAAAFISGFVSLLKSQYVAVPQYILDIWYWTMPDNTIACLMLVFTAQFMRAIFDIRIKLLDKYSDMVKIN